MRMFTYLSGFFLSMNVALPSYFNAQFINQFLDETKVGIIFAISSVLGIFFISLMPKVARRVGILRTTTWMAVLKVAIVLFLISSHSGFWSLFFFVLYYAVNYTFFYNMDLYLESLSDDAKTGKIRGIYLTVVNLAWLCSPFLAGYLLRSQAGFDGLYLLTAVVLLPLIYLTVFKLKETPAGNIKKTNVFHALRQVLAKKDQLTKNVFHILLVDFLLNFFYTIMIVYMGLYLINEKHFSVLAISVIFTIMLIPFVVLDYPMGKIADRYGEKKSLLLSLLFMAATTMVISFITSQALWVWALALMATRVGASIMEIMKETYLFKQIDEQDASVLCISRNLAPVAYIIGPIVGSVFLTVFDLRYIFLFLGLVVLTGIYPILKLRDTK